ncbi:MAG: Alanine--tRNA ligase [Chloroflexi bacterium]|nr:Alanine--tRNA ligase [Chloroflexota bacterium]
MTKLTGNQIRQMYIDFFEDKGHKFVRSSSLVPGGDATLLFTNAGMVQFKDVFLGTDKRDYTRAANSQKCMRVAGKHNDLEDVGRDDTHHTFFEMMGNWSFGDYYKKEAIAWAWELLTEVWGLPKESLYATVFKDEKGEIPTDDEAAGLWRKQPGFHEGHLFYLGRKDNFWEMGDTGPCGPCSEIHIDLQPEEGLITDKAILDTDRVTELWNLVFIQYNRKDEDHLDPLPATHVDTGLGLERTVAVLQGTTSNYRTDLLFPLLAATQKLTGHTDKEREANITPYRVIADHARAAAFLIADGVIPGNLGRNYICRMIIRRAYRFGGHVGLHEPFLSKIALNVIKHYAEAYPELERDREIILDTITREEEQFQRTLNKGTAHLEDLLDTVETTLPGDQAADLYTTYGMPLEITRDIAQERGLSVDEDGFHQAMEEHRIASGAGESMGEVGGEEVEVYSALLADLQADEKLGPGGVEQNPHGALSLVGDVLALVHRQGRASGNSQPVGDVTVGERVSVILPQTPFYIEAGGQVSDTGTITGVPSPQEPSPQPSPTGSDSPLPVGEGPGVRETWEIRVEDIHQPAAGIIVHTGTVTKGQPRVGDRAAIHVDAQRRKDIMRNHTGTHLLHAALDKIIGDHARQAGSLVAPDHLRFDFTHPQALTPKEVEAVEAEVNRRILENHRLQIEHKPIQQAIDEGARALFGEKYGDTVRTIQTGDFSYELCGGTHCETTGDIGVFLITSEGSAAAGIRRIVAVTGREAYKLIQKRTRHLKDTAQVLSANLYQTVEKAQATVDELAAAEKEIEKLRQKVAAAELVQALDKTMVVGDINVLTAILDGADMKALRQMADRFRQKYPENGVAVLGTVIDGSPLLIAAVTEDLVSQGIKAGDLVQFVAQQVGGGGGGRPTLAQAGGKDPSKLKEALDSVRGWVEGKS